MTVLDSLPISMTTLDNVIIKELSTRVRGLDEVLGGGLPEYSFNLIAGAPGTGKTTLSQQLMFALATPECPALHFTVVGEPSLKLLRYQQRFSFFDSARVGTSSLARVGGGATCRSRDKKTPHPVCGQKRVK